jgi:hypothetical protein
MLWTPKKGYLRTQHNIGTVAVVPGTSVTTGAAANTKGTPAEIFSSTQFDAYLVHVQAAGYGSSGVASEGALDILIGAATEEVLIPNLLMGYCGGFPTSQRDVKQWLFPLYIPAGSRIAAQAAGARTSTAFRVIVQLYGGDGYPPFRVGSKVTTYGMGTVPNGTTVTPGASGAEGAWAQLTSGTSEDHFAWTTSFQLSADTTTNSRVLLADLGVGGAGSEVEFLQSHMYLTQADETMGGPANLLPTFRDIPSGSAISMRVSNGGTNDGAYNAVAHAVS